MHDTFIATYYYTNDILCFELIDSKNKQTSIAILLQSGAYLLIAAT
jgi:hypothetical protein